MRTCTPKFSHKIEQKLRRHKRQNGKNRDRRRLSGKKTHEKEHGIMYIEENEAHGTEWSSQAKAK